MANFSYAQYQEVINKAQSSNSGTKVGFFKLKDDGDEALVRINCATVEDLIFATVHTINADGKWMKVSCLNPVGSYADTCALCSAAAAGNKAISKASKKVYIQMLVAYKNKATGQFEAPIPVIWERPAAFSREIANLLRDYGSLKEVVLKITRNGAAGDMKTTYSIGFIPLYNKPEFIPVSGFAAFEGFKIERHSYWEKSAEDIMTFMQTGNFPEASKANTPSQTSVQTFGYSIPNSDTSATSHPYISRDSNINPTVVSNLDPNVVSTTMTPPIAPVPEASTPTRTVTTPAGSENTPVSERPVRNFSYKF